jgi:hypothetical protein
MTSEGVSVCEGWAGAREGWRAGCRVRDVRIRMSEVGSRRSDVGIANDQLSEIDISILHFGLLITVAPFVREG